MLEPRALIAVGLSLPFDVVADGHQYTYTYKYKTYMGNLNYQSPPFVCFGGWPSIVHTCMLSSLAATYSRNMLFHNRLVKVMGRKI